MTLSQPAGAFLRHAVLLAVSIFGVLTQSVTALHLPLAVSSIMTAAYPVLLLVEHFVADPSTGSTPVVTPVTPVPTVPAVPGFPPAAQAAVSAVPAPVLPHTVGGATSS